MCESYCRSHGAKQFPNAHFLCPRPNTLLGQPRVKCENYERFCMSVVLPWTLREMACCQPIALLLMSFILSCFGGFLRVRHAAALTHLLFFA